VDFLTQAILRHAAERPAAAALRGLAGEISYAALPSVIGGVAEVLLGRSPRVIGLAVDNSPAWAVVDLAAMQAGIAIVPLPFFFSAGQMQQAMRDAGLNPDQIQYVNAHGTSTPLGDKNETEAIKAALGDHAKKVVVNSTKSMTGHLLGGAGGLESVFTILALHHQKSPPTINIFNQDPECDLDYCANNARDVKIDHAIKNNFGFGGTNGTLIFGKLT
jgi:3-oxoacyl-(acyl-carrier-protein) synthase